MPNEEYSMRNEPLSSRDIEILMKWVLKRRELWPNKLESRPDIYIVT